MRNLRTDRARDKSQQPSSLRRRRLKHGGRKSGTPNKTTQELMDAVLEAAERVGSDLHGKDGLIGYLMRVGRKDTKAFGSLLRAVLPLKIKITTEPDRSMPFWFPAYFNGELEALAEKLEKKLSLEVKLLP